MKFLLDQGIPRSTVAQLLDQGFEAEHVGPLGTAMALDAEIPEAAGNRDAIIVTLDADFHALLAATSSMARSKLSLPVT